MPHVQICAYYLYLFARCYAGNSYTILAVVCITHVHIVPACSTSVSSAYGSGLHYMLALDVCLLPIMPEVMLA